MISLNVHTRGLGHWQKKILRQLEQTDSFTLNELLPVHYTEAERVALHRAARTLASRGLIVNKRRTVEVGSRSLTVLPRVRFTLKETFSRGARDDNRAKIKQQLPTLTFVKAQELA